MLVPHMARAGAALLRQADVLVPVPLHRRRLFLRRYNQAALLTHGLARAARRPVLPDARIRTRATSSLGDKSATERAGRGRRPGAARVSRIARVVGRRVLLIDDVMTSGVTANACAGGAAGCRRRRADVLVAARVPDPRLT